MTFEIIETENSVYELDRAGKRVRRVSGRDEPTNRFSPEGSWQDYSTFGHCGGRFYVTWDDGNYTLSSPIKGEDPSRCSTD